VNGLLKMWEAIVELVTVIILVVTAIGIMVGVVELSHALKRIAITLGCMVMLLVLPPTIVGIWHSLSGMAQIQIVALSGLAGFIAFRWAVRQPRMKSKR
jgi:hypothetical protein